MLLTLRALTVTLGPRTLLENAGLAIEAGERIALIGRNGTGKSTLLRLLAGDSEPDAGQVEWRQGLRLGYLPQDTPATLTGPVFSVVADGLGESAALIRRYHDLTEAVTAGQPSALAALEAVQHELEARDAWQLSHRVEAILTRLKLPLDAAFETLSGGIKRRALLARALVGAPDLLLLDEPTNHLDIDAIAWLEAFLRGLGCALVFVTHDRRFLQAVATRIVELDRARLTSWPGDYATYERRKTEALEAEARAQAQFDRRLAREEAWIRQGVKARRTRNEGRVRALQAMRRERAARREGPGQAQIAIQETERSGRLAIRAESIGFARDGTAIVRDFETTILRGDRIGLVGPNGIGKTTLLALLLGELAPDAGRVRHGTRLEVAYFDQHRAALDPSATVIDNVAGGAETLSINGRSRHVISYLEDFLFPPERARTSVSALSGGERSRVMMARLFAEPANLLVLDEPTNDLDIETLEVLEARLAAFEGTVLLVSHDRAFLDNTVTSLYVFEGGGRIREHVGGYDAWLRQAESSDGEHARAPAGPTEPRRARRAPTKLGYKDQRELDGLPAHIEGLETEIHRLQSRLADPALYEGNAGTQVTELQTELADREARLEQAFERWEVLESRRNALAADNN